MIEQDKNPGKSKVLVMGVTFKEDVAEIRNSKVVDLIKEFQDYFIQVEVVDPHGGPTELKINYGIDLLSAPTGNYDSIVLAVGHSAYRNLSPMDFENWSQGSTYLFDIKGVLDGKQFVNYWRL